MTDQRIDVAALPALKITQRTFDVLPEFRDDKRPQEKNGVTWRMRPGSDPAAPWVICRYVGLKDSPGCSIEMVRPEITVAAPFTTPRTKTGKIVR